MRLFKTDCIFIVSNCHNICEKKRGKEGLNTVNNRRVVPDSNFTSPKRLSWLRASISFIVSHSQVSTVQNSVLLALVSDTGFTNSASQNSSFIFTFRCLLSGIIAMSYLLSTIWIFKPHKHNLFESFWHSLSIIFPDPAIYLWVLNIDVIPMKHLLEIWSKHACRDILKSPIQTWWVILNHEVFLDTYLIPCHSPIVTSQISHWRQIEVTRDNSPYQSIVRWLSLNHQRLPIGRSFPLLAFQPSDWWRERRNQFPVYVYVPQLEEGVAVSWNPPMVTDQQGSSK